VLNPLFFLTLFCAAADWIAVWRGARRWMYVFKPATLVAVILWGYSLTGWQGDLLWFGLALLFGLAGDVALMFTQQRLFRVGLVAFFVGHLFYLAGLNSGGWPALGWETLALAGTVAVIWLFVFRIIRAGVRSHPASRRLDLPTTVYSIVLSLMWLSALLTLIRPGWNLTAAVLVALGGTLFELSDSMLSYNLFVNRIPHAQFWVHLTYHLAQLGIIGGVILNARM
jgi:alkenylglycerophosphocholine hydrolase